MAQDIHKGERWIYKAKLRKSGHRPVNPVCFDESKIVGLVSALNVGVGVRVSLQELVYEGCKLASLTTWELAMLMTSDRRNTHVVRNTQCLIDFTASNLFGMSDKEHRKNARLVTYLAAESGLRSKP